MFQNKQYFLDFLVGHAKQNVLFEPFIRRSHAETLIWRRGEHLWDTPDAYVNTLAALSHRTRADVVFCDIRLFADDKKFALIHAIESYDNMDGIGFGIICGNEHDLKLAEDSTTVCTAAVYGGAVSDILPIIRMDGSLEDAIKRGDSGWYAPMNAETYLQYVKQSNSKMRILGGLGRDFILRGAPIEIYSTVERLSHEYFGMWACGSGFEIPDDNYLELISLLGAFGRIR